MHVCVCVCAHECVHWVCVMHACVCVHVRYADTSKLPNAFMWWEEVFLLLFLSVIVGVAREGISFSLSQQHIILG